MPKKILALLRFFPCLFLFGFFSFFHCTPIYHTTQFYYSSQQTFLPGNLAGPFTGTVVDQNFAPISNAVVIGVWDYIENDPIQTPNKTYRKKTTTSDKGIYSLAFTPPFSLSKIRLVRFTMTIYSNDKITYRSDLNYFPAQARADFYQTENIAQLQDIPKSFSHNQHLLFLGSAIQNLPQEAALRLSKLAQQELTAIETQKIKELISPQIDIPNTSQIPPEEPPPSIKSEIPNLEVLHTPLKNFFSKHSLSFGVIDFSKTKELPIRVNTKGWYQETTVPPSKEPMITHYKNMIGFKDSGSVDLSYQLTIQLWQPLDPKQTDLLLNSMKNYLGFKVAKSRNRRKVALPSPPSWFIKPLQPSLYLGLGLVKERDWVYLINCTKKLCPTHKKFKSLMISILKNLNDIPIQSNQP